MTMTARRLRQIANEIKGSQLMVIGDIMLDEYAWGDVSRISPEAPVPVIEVDSVSTRLGGAANVVANLCSLGVKPAVLAVCGRDADGKRLTAMIGDMGCRTDGIYASAKRPTTIKTRIMARQQQIVRVDKEDSADLTNREHEALLAKFDKLINKVKGVIISDYGKGVVSEPFIKEVLLRCKKKGVFVSVDPKERHFNLYQGVDVITPNLKEAHAALGLPVAPRDDKEIKKMGWDIMKKLQLQYLLITLSERGMALFGKEDHKLRTLPTQARTVFDVTGAGDTVISVFSVARTCGATPVEAAFMANHAAGITVARVGTASVGIEELLKACRE